MNFIYPPDNAPQVDYDNYVSRDYLELQANKIYSEMVRVFSPMIATLPKSNPVCTFLAKKKLYLGPYLDSKEDDSLRTKAACLFDWVNTGQPTYASINPNGTVRRKAFVDGMLMHAFNGGAAEFWHGRDRTTISDREYTGQMDTVDMILANTKTLESAAWNLSTAITEMNLDKALSACFADEWALAKLKKPNPQPPSDMQQPPDNFPSYGPK